MKVTNPDAEERRKRALGDLMQVMGEPVDDNVRQIFEDAGMLENYEYARAEMIAKGGDPNNVTLWRAVIQGMRDRAEMDDATRIIGGLSGRKMV